MKLTGKTSVDDVDAGSSRGLTYNLVPDGDEWNINFAKELIGIKSGDHQTNLTRTEIDEILHVITT